METIKEAIQKNCARILNVPGVNISELSRLTKISASTIHKWKTGVHVPEATNIEKLAEALSISPLEFYKKDGGDKQKEVAVVTINDAVKILDKISKLNDKNREIVLKSINTLLNTQDQVKDKKVNS